MQARRRRVAAAVVALAGLVGGWTLAWFVVLPHHRPALRADESYGIDVSNHQGLISWSAVAADDVRFAYVKATEGKTFVDPYFAGNVAAAQAAGVRTGAYHFFSLCSSGQDQADAFLRTAPPSTTALPPALDLEILSGCDDRPSPAAVQTELDTFVDRVERAWGERLLIYARSSWTRDYPLPAGADRPRWRTSFFVRPDRTWAVWQVHYFAEVDGVAGRVDLDVVRPLELSG
jgi:lysozyme